MGNIILINKEKEWTSNDVVQKIKRSCNYKKVGHAGTLDPNATGLLILGINDGTKKLTKLILDSKQYIATIDFDYSTDSGDITGKIINTKNKTVIELNVLKKQCDFFLNNYYQKPHKYSAVKINGKKAYEYARNNIDVEIKEKIVNLYHYEIIDFDECTNRLIIKLDVSKGFYVRSFVEDLSQRLQTYGCLIELERTKCGEYSIENSLKVNEYIESIRKDI